MLGTIFSFEVRYWLRGMMLWVFTAIVALLIFGAASTDSLVVGSQLENTHRNAPHVIQNFYSVTSLLTLLMITAFVNSAAARDFANGTWQMVFSTPVSRRDFLWGRFLGSVVVSVIPMLGVSAGVIVARWMPWVDAERWGPVHWQAHLLGIVDFAIPNAVFMAAVIFTIAALTRSTVISFVGSIVMMVGYGVGEALASDIENERLAMLLDPFGMRTFSLMTKYWTVAEKNTVALGLEGMMLWNRLLWMSVGAAVFGFCCWKFSFAERARRVKAGAAEAEAAPGRLERDSRRCPQHGVRRDSAGGSHKLHSQPDPQCETRLRQRDFSGDVLADGHYPGNVLPGISILGLPDPNSLHQRLTPVPDLIRIPFPRAGQCLRMASFDHRTKTKTDNMPVSSSSFDTSPSQPPFSQDFHLSGPIFTPPAAPRSAAPCSRTAGASDGSQPTSASSSGRA
ncbi:MAG: ABC transporter permease [Acidobacteria bacterium]|nr:ABC transporter permease [Acidobacteriota bacterium]